MMVDQLLRFVCCGCRKDGIGEPTTQSSPSPSRQNEKVIHGRIKHIKQQRQQQQQQQPFGDDHDGAVAQNNNDLIFNGTTTEQEQHISNDNTNNTNINNNNNNSCRIGQQIVFETNNVTTSQPDVVLHPLSKVVSTTAAAAAAAAVGVEQLQPPPQIVSISSSSVAIPELLYQKPNIRQYDMNEGNTFRRQQQQQQQEQLATKSMVESSMSSSQQQLPRSSTQTYSNEPLNFEDDDQDQAYQKNTVKIKNFKLPVSITMGKRQPPSKRVAAKSITTKEEISDSDDEEIDEDEAFNSDDERKYGSYFDDQTRKGKQHGMDDEDDDEEDDDDDDGNGSNEEDGDDDEESNSEDESDAEEDDGGQYMLDLLKNLDDDTAKTGKERTNASLVAPHIPESQFASSVIPNALLTLDSLMEGLKDTKGYGTIQKTMKHVAQGQATSAPLAKVVSDRVQRKVNYEIQSQEISLWSKAVQENRHAESLDFRPKQRLDVSRDMMIDQFVPTTDYEKEIHTALLAAGEQDEIALRRQEDALDDDLGKNTITIEEYKKRHGQLAKMRALMFYHEQKRHHMNKIKSKKYRKIRKKQKERINEAELEAQINDDPNVVRELQEKEEVTRMQERATLAHKNTSKWAKRMLKRGKNLDVDTRRALSAQLQRGEDLRQRMTAQNSDSDHSDNDDNLVAQARGILADTEGNDGNDSAGGLGKGIFQLAFMKKGLEKQRERAKEEARQLLMELEDDENSIEEDDRNTNHDNDTDCELELHTEQNKRKPKKQKVATAKEMEHILKDDALMVESLKHGTASTIATSGTIDINTGFTSTSSLQLKYNGEDHELPVSTGETRVNAGSEKKRGRADIFSVPPASKSDESNPWLAIVETESNTTNKDSPPNRGKSTQTDIASQTARLSKMNRLFVDVDRAVDLLENTPRATKSNSIATPDLKDGTVNPVMKKNLIEKNITTLTQDELIQRAFATQQEQIIGKEQDADNDDDSFAQEKARIEEDEDPTRRIKKEKEMKVSKGWGDWAGEGVKAPGPAHTKKLSFLPKKLQPPPAMISNKRPRADAKKPNVIISEKRISKLADKYMIKAVPYPYTTREEYERSIKGGVGREWNVTDSFKDLTRPEIYARAGKVIQPLSKKVKQVRTPAKF